MGSNGGQDRKQQDRKQQDRKHSRRSWPIRVRKLTEPDGPDLAATTTAEERLAMMWPLALEAWRLAGRPIPEYDRAEIPARVIRGCRSRDTEDS